ncbi:uncharacterized protein LOC143300343 [Babylonia areolata]|uniref:uncharacterized protein LOC143300343 n=1 Tax=Babylonia areolata TaxID=304850 RepID=UPI003FD49E68
MIDPDETGWHHIHHCAFRGYIKSLERFVENDPDSLELQTNDDLGSTPFLLAVSSGIQDTVESLIGLGSKVNVINSQNHGAVEICAIKQFMSLLEFFLAKDLEQLPVWKNLLRMMGSDMEEEVIASGTCLRNLTTPSTEGIHPNWEPFYLNGGVPVICKVAKSTLAEDSKVPVLQLLLNVIGRPEVQEQVVGTGGIPALIRLLKSSDTYIVQLSATAIREVAKNPGYSELLMQNGALPALHRVLQTVHDPEVQTPTVQAIGSMAASGEKQRITVGTTPGCIGTMVGLFETATGNADLLLALTEAVSNVAHESRDNQNTYVDEGVTQHIVNVILNQARNKRIQESAVEAIHRLAASNPHVQHDVLERGAERLLMQLLKKRNAESLQEKTAMALWALAGDDLNEKREMANGIGVQTLIEFTNSMSENLHLIGSEGLGVLAQGPLNQQSQIGTANGVYPLVRLLRSANEEIVLSVIRSLRHLCVGVGNVPNARNQATISTSRGVKLLVALMVHSQRLLIQVEAAFTLGCVSLGNNDLLEEIHSNLDFSYVRVLKMLYAQDDDVRLLAGSALAAFAYNSIQQQREIADQGGVRYNCFVSFLRSHNELHRCHAAYQVVVLARIIPDEEQAKSSAVGIKLLVDLLDQTSGDDVRALAASYIACLAHTRAGVPSAIVAVQAVEYLCDMLLSKSEQVRGNAAIALGYLSYNHAGERHLLNKCRLDPYLMLVIKHYTKRSKLSPAFVEGWRHYKKVGLPPIPEGRPSLIRARPPRDDMRPITILSLEDTPSGSGHVRSSASNLEHAGDDTGRTSRASRESRATRQSLHASHLSLDSQRTQASMMQEMVMVEEV